MNTARPAQDLQRPARQARLSGRGLPGPCRSQAWGEQARLWWAFAGALESQRPLYPSPWAGNEAKQLSKGRLDPNVLPGYGLTSLARPSSA